ncbi:UNVERIFIED_CONTAM: nuclear receptor corepressor 2 [Gekko kuhli]
MKREVDGYTEFKGVTEPIKESQELHARADAHAYLSDLSKQSELDFIETKRPRLELLQDPLMRHSPLLNQSQQGGTEDLSKVSPAAYLEPG